MPQASNDTIKPSIWVVEDDSDVLKYLHLRLSLRGYEVSGFETADEAKTALQIAIFNKKHVELILLDKQLATSTISSEQLLEFICRKRPRPQVIVMSGYLSSRDFAQFLLKGADNFLQKPFETDKLFAMIDDHLKLSRDRYEYNRHPWKIMKRTQRDVFISYSTKNDAWALAVARFLENSGIHVWHANLDLLPGDIWQDKLTDALKECPIFLVFLSKDALVSKAVNDEISQAINRKRVEGDRYHFIPLIYDLKDEDIPGELRKIHYVDFSDIDMFSDNIQKVIFSIENFRFQHNCKSANQITVTENVGER